MLRMERAYADMVQVEVEKQKAREEKEELRKITKERKNRSVVNKFAQAESIRQEQRRLRQSRFMEGYLKTVDAKQGRQEKLARVALKFEGMRQRITELEKTEQDLVQSVQHSRNWHSRLESGTLDTLATFDIEESKRLFQPDESWKI